jgi:hypothetical protein
LRSRDTGRDAGRTPHIPARDRTNCRIWGLGQRAVLIGDEDLGVVVDVVVVSVGQRVVTEQVAQAEHDRVDVGEGAFVP